MPSITLHELARLLGVPAPPSNPVLTGVATLTEAAGSDLSFLGSDTYINDFNATRAGAVLVDKKVKRAPDTAVPVLLVPDADLAIAQLLSRFAPAIPAPPR